MTTDIEKNLTDYLSGFVRNSPANRTLLIHYPDWQRMAQQELDRRSSRLLERLPDDVLRAIAQGDIDLALLAGNLPD